MMYKRVATEAQEQEMLLRYCTVKQMLLSKLYKCQS